MSDYTWQFTPLDTWFFRESRPMESVGSSLLNSVFPPSPRTMSGAIRTLLGEHHNVNWETYTEEKVFEVLHRQIGDAYSMGDMRIRGPWVTRYIVDDKKSEVASSSEGGSWQRLYPAPANLLYQHVNDKLQRVIRLEVGEPLDCDLGKKVRMPTIPKMFEKVENIKPRNDVWISKETLEAFLSGKDILADSLVFSSALYDSEDRLGIARDYQSRTARKSMLYQTSHLRLNRQVGLEVDVLGVKIDQPEKGLVRLGGEGRMASFAIAESLDTDICIPRINEKTNGLTITLLTPMGLSGQVDRSSPLPGFQKASENGQTVWKGVVENQKMTLHSAAMGKAIREGGWNLAKRKPRSVKSLTPAGSTFYLTVDSGDLKGAMDAVHLKQLGQDDMDMALGRGLMVAGLWQASEY